jgi:hypothetical protein
MHLSPKETDRLRLFLAAELARRHVADLRKRFRLMGDAGAYYFLYVVGERVPPHDEWQARRQAGRR